MNRISPDSRASKTLAKVDSKAKTQVRSLANRRKIQTRAASRAAANKEIRNDSGNELLASPAER